MDWGGLDVLLRVSLRMAQTYHGLFGNDSPGLTSFFRLRFTRSSGHALAATGYRSRGRSHGIPLGLSLRVGARCRF